MFTVGQKVRCIKESSLTNRLLLGHVYMVNKIDGEYLYVTSEAGYSEEWCATRFIPFEWQEGDAFKIVKEGQGLSKPHIGKCGHLIKKKEYWEDDEQCWDTDIPKIVFPNKTYYVGESQIEFIQPNGNTSIDVSMEQPAIEGSAPTQQAENLGAASAPQGRRYLNKAV